MKAEAEIHSQWWKIKWEDISVQAAKASFGSSCSSVRVVVAFVVPVSYSGRAPMAGTHPDQRECSLFSYKRLTMYDSLPTVVFYRGGRPVIYRNYF